MCVEYISGRFTAPLKLSWWRESSTGYSALRNDIFQEIEVNGRTSGDLNRILGTAIETLNNLIDGNEVAHWEAVLIERAIGRTTSLKRTQSSTENENLRGSNIEFESASSGFSKIPGFAETTKARRTSLEANRVATPP